MFFCNRCGRSPRCPVRMPACQPLTITAAAAGPTSPTLLPATVVQCTPAAPCVAHKHERCARQGQHMQQQPPPPTHTHPQMPICSSRLSPNASSTCPLHTSSPLCLTSNSSPMICGPRLEGSASRRATATPRHPTATRRGMPPRPLWPQ
jgi:hypothetical protein